MENWKDIKGFEGRYQISDMGNVLSLKYKRGKKPKPLRPSINGEGYKNVSLRNGIGATNRTVHTLVAEHFIPNPMGLPQINHLDGNKLNCCVTNLEWSTSGDNTRHAIKIGLRVKTGDNSKKRILIDTVSLKVYPSIRLAAKNYSVNYHTLRWWLSNDKQNKTTLRYMDSQ